MFFSQAENCENGEAEVGLAWAVKVLDASKDGEVVKFTIQTNMVRRFRMQLIMKQYTLMREHSSPLTYIAIASWLRLEVEL